MPHFDNHGLRGGTWRGRLTGLDRAPARILLVQHAEVLAQGRLTADGEDAWLVEVDLPREVLSDGVQTLLLKADDGVDEEAEAAESRADGHLLARLPLMAGQPLDGDLTTEIATLRAELELVKRELRRLAVQARGA